MRAVTATIGRLLLGFALAAPLLNGAPAAPVRAAKTKGHTPNVRVMFDSAQRLFDGGKYSDALNAYENLLRKYSGHMPAQIQMAKTLYRLDRIKEAQVLFARINPKDQDLDAETSYEYGWSFYTIKAWDGALVGMQRVPAGHSLFDLANYYGAISAIKLKRYDLAEDMLDKAVVLPDKLAKSRTMYIKHVQALRLMHERAALAQDRVQEKDTINSPASKKPRAKKEHDIPTVIFADGTQKHQGFQSIEHAAIVKLKNDHQNISGAGLSQKSYDATIASFDFSNGLLWPLPLTAGKDPQGALRQSAIGFQLTLAAENRATKGTEQRTLPDTTWASLARQLNADLGTAEAKSGRAAGEVWGELALPASLWATLGGEYSLTYYDFQRGQRIGYRQAYALLRGKYAWGNTGAEGHFGSILATTGHTIAQVNDVAVSADTEVMPKLVLATKLTYDTYDYVDRGQDLDGPDHAVSAEFSATQRLPLGIKLQLTGSYQQQSNYIFHHVPSFPAVTADGRVLTGKGSLEIAPLPFVSAGLSELLTTTKWAQSNANADDSFAVAVPDYVEYFTVWAAINLAF